MKFFTFSFSLKVLYEDFDKTVQFEFRCSLSTSLAMPSTFMTLSAFGGTFREHLEEHLEEHSK